MAEVEVTGLTDDVDTDYMILYFESRRCSGGGSIKSYTRSGCEAYLTFTDPSDAEKVLSQADHQIKGVKVLVQRPPPWDPGKVALRGLNPNTDEATLRLYIENMSHREMFSTVLSADRTMALIAFEEPLSDGDIEVLIQRVGGRGLQGASISVQRVRVSKEVLVRNVGPQISSEYLEMYFENRRSGGGHVHSLTMHKDSASAIVSFVDMEVADNVLKRTHTLQNCELLLSPYYPTILGPLQAPCTSILDEEVPQNHEQTEAAGRPEQGMEYISLPSQTQEQNPVHMEEERTENKGVPTEENELVPIEVHVDYEMEAQQEGENDLGSKGLYSHSPLDHLDHDNIAVTESDQPSGLSEEILMEMEVLMKAAELRFLQEHTHDLLAGMDQVTVLPLEMGDKTGFKVTGNTVSCQTAVELLLHIKSSLSSRSITLENPGIACFLLSDEGQRVIRVTEEEFQCVIDTSRLSWRALDIEYVDPWSLIKDTVPMELSSDHTPPPPDEVIVPPSEEASADMENIKVLASVLKHFENEAEMAEVSCDGHPLSTPEVDLPPKDANKSSDDSSDDFDVEEPDVEQWEKACKLSREEYQEQELDEEAQLLLAIQRSMDTQQLSEDDDQELQRALAMSMKDQGLEETLQRALEMSLQEQDCAGSVTTMERAPERSIKDPCTQDHRVSNARGTRTEVRSSEHANQERDSVCIRVFAGDETSLVVACAALRKSIMGELNTVILDGTWDLHEKHSIIFSALQSKHGVKITVCDQQIQVQGFGETHILCRQELTQILDSMKDDRPPGQMTNIELQKDVEIIPLPETCEEYKQVVCSYYETLNDLKAIIQVMEVHKVKNSLLTFQYELKKQSMLLHKIQEPVERTLYHGTTGPSAKEICHHGFNRSFCGKNATIYGQGVYFAINAALSSLDKYSPPSEEGKKFVLVAQVLTGEFTRGKSNMRTPPILPDSIGDASRRYDSLVDNTQSPALFVIFNDTQAYPQYLITCRKCKPGPR